MAMNVDSIQRRARDLGVRDRVRSALEKTEFDAIVATSTDNVQYLSSRWYPILRTRITRPNVVVWPRSGEPVLVAGSEQVAGYKRDSWIADFRTYEERGRSSLVAVIDTLSDTLKELGLHRSSLGFEAMYLPTAHYQRLSASLPDATLISCDEFLDGLRMVKTNPEIELISNAALAADRAIREALEVARAGWTEKQLADEIIVRILRNGCDMVTTILLGSGEGARGYLTPTEHVLTPGEMVRIDLNALLGGYYADMGRTAFVGDAPTAYHRCYAAQWELNQAIIQMIKPGIQARDVLDFCQKTAGRMGLRLLVQPFIGLGHGTGINPSELPKLGDNDSTVIAPGMVLNIEPDIFGPADEVVHVEEMLVVGPERNEILTRGADWKQLFEIRA